MRGTSVDYYQVLGVSPSASLEDIKRRYRQLSKKHHPDTPTGDEQLMARINEAYATLSDPVKRHFYTSTPKVRPEKPAQSQTQHAQTRYAYNRSQTAQKKRAQAAAEEEKGPSGWVIFLTYTLAIPLAIFLVTLLTPVANRLFTSSDNTTITTTGSSTTSPSQTNTSTDTNLVTPAPETQTTPIITETPSVSQDTSTESLTPSTTDSQSSTTTNGNDSSSTQNSTQSNNSRSVWGYGFRRYR